MLNLLHRNLLQKMCTGSKVGLQRSFAAASRNQSTPNYFRDPKHTKSGYFQSVRSKPKQYNLEGVPNAHLYYDHKIDGKNQRKIARQRQLKLRGEPGVESTTYEDIISDLTNPDVLARGSAKTFIRIRQLEENHVENQAKWLRVVEQTLKNILGGRFVQYRTREFGILQDFFFCLLTLNSLNSVAKYASVTPDQFKNLSNYVAGLYLSPPTTSEDGETTVQIKRRSYMIFSLNKILDKSPLIRSDQAVMETHQKNCTMILKNSIEKDFLTEITETGLVALFVDQVSRHAKTHTLSPSNIQKLKLILESQQQGAEKQKKNFAELTSIRKIEVAFQFKNPSTKAVLMQTIKQFKDKTPLGVIFDLINDLAHLEDFKSDSAVLAALRPHILKMGTRIQSEEHPFTVEELSKIKTVLLKANVDAQEIQKVKDTINMQFRKQEKLSRKQNIIPYFQNLEGTPEDSVVQSFINDLRVGQKMTKEWYQQSLSAIGDLQSDLVKELKLELEIGMKLH